MPIPFVVFLLRSARVSRPLLSTSWPGITLGVETQIRRGQAHLSSRRGCRYHRLTRTVTAWLTPYCHQDFLRVIMELPTARRRPHQPCESIEPNTLPEGFPARFG